jgi:uncharacterized lipoprotein YajG
MKKALLISALVIAVCGCAPKPKNMIINTPEPLEYSNIYRGQNFKVVVQDSRREKHLIKVLDSDGDAVLHQPGSPIVKNLSMSLKQSFKAQGLTVNEYAGPKLLLEIIQMETVVEQSMVDYDAALTVEFRLTIDHMNNRSYHKIFTGHSTRGGILRFDLALLERDMNALIEQVLDDMYQDQFVQQTIQS